MKYKITKAYSVGSGSLLDKSNTPIPFTQLAPKLGDIIEGEIKPHFVFNTTISGVEIEIGLPAGQSTKIIIPESSLTAVSSTSSATSNTISSWITPELNIYTAGGAMAGMGIGFGMYQMSKNKSLLRLIMFCIVGGVSGMIAGQITTAVIGKK